MFKSLIKIENSKFNVAMPAILSSALTIHSATILKAHQRPLNNIGLIGCWIFDGNKMSPNVSDYSEQGNDGNLSGQISATTALGKIDDVRVYSRVVSDAEIVRLYSLGR
jgi:hypothetical protein